MSIRKNPIAYLALFIALGGTSYAATQLPANSVGAAQLRNGAVIDAKVKRHTLTAGSLAPGVIQSGLKTTIVEGIQIPYSCPIGEQCPPMATAGAVIVPPPVFCPQGYRALGGGYDVSNNGAEMVTSSDPTSQDNGWQITVVLTQSEVYDGWDKAIVVCGSLR